MWPAIRTGIGTFIFSCLILSFVISIALPMDPTGNPECDAIEDEIAGPAQARLGIGIILVSALFGWLAGRRRHCRELRLGSAIDTTPRVSARVPA